MKKLYRPALTRAQLDGLIATVTTHLANSIHYLNGRGRKPRDVEATRKLITQNEALLHALRTADTHITD